MHFGNHQLEANKRVMGSRPILSLQWNGVFASDDDMCTQQWQISAALRDLDCSRQAELSVPARISLTVASGAYRQQTSNRLEEALQLAKDDLRS